LPTSASVNGFSVVVSYHDTHNPALESIDYTLSFAFRVVNQAPQLQFITGSQTEADFGTGLVDRVSVRIAQGSGGASIGYNMRDVDAGEGDVRAIVNLALAPGVPATAVVLTFRNEGGVVNRNQEFQWIIDAPLAVITAELSSMAFDVTGVTSAQFNFTIEVDDNGLSGACTPDNVNPCHKYATALLIVSASTQANAVAIGLAAGAGGAALAAAAAAAIAWRALREPPTESYNPWEMDDAVEGTVMNPLFEASGNSGDNPMFEGAGK